MRSVDMAALSGIMREVAAEHVLPRFRNLADGEVENKRDGSLVTVADKAAEGALSRSLLDLLPGSRFVGEETYAADPSILSALDGDEMVWICDPVDGTRQFVEGDDRFGMLVSLCRGSEIVAAAAYSPARGIMTVAERGSGVHRDGRKLSISGRAAGGSFNVKRLAAASRVRFGANAPGDFRYEINCSWEYQCLVGDENAVYVTANVTPWDTSTGVLLQREAGGYVGYLDDRPYVPSEKRGTLMYAPDLETWTGWRERLFGPHVGPTEPTLIS